MRMIDADALELSMMTSTFGEAMRYCYPCVEVIKAIKNAPTIEERKTGKWVWRHHDEETGIDNTHWCSVCGQPMGQISENYCAVCGAKMEPKWG